jgi:glycosyltransferase involved in cell wall biosynthesis
MVNSISAIVITKDEERNLRDCLQSIQWVNEIVVVDAGSKDQTVEIAKEFTQKIFIRPWDGYGAAKNYALSQCTGDWVLWIDADERITALLKAEISNALATVPDSIAAFSMPRLANFLGSWIHHCGWYPGRITRLFKRSTGSFTEDKVHERLLVQGTTVALKSDLLHYTDPNLTHYYEKFNKYTSLAADELISRGKRYSLLKLMANPLLIFIKMYFVRLGFLDGIAGLILCVGSANYVFTKYAKLWERSYKKGEAHGNK